MKYRKEKYMTYKYDPESDVLALSSSEQSFDYAEEVGDFIVHFNSSNKPVYVEILNARKFLSKASNLLPESVPTSSKHA